MIGKEVAHHVLWTFVDTKNASTSFNPNSVTSGSGDGATYNLTWIWYIVLIELVLAAGVAVMAYFLARTILRNKKSTAEAPVNGNE